MADWQMFMFVLLGWVLPLAGFVAGWYVTNEHWKRAFPVAEDLLERDLTAVNRVHEWVDTQAREKRG